MTNSYNSSNNNSITKKKSAQNHSVRSDAMKKLEALRNADILTCNADELVDLRNVASNRKAPLKRRTDDYIEQVGNPYLFKVGDTVVKIEFGGEKDFSEIFKNVIAAG